MGYNLLITGRGATLYILHSYFFLLADCLNGHTQFFFRILLPESKSVLYDRSSNAEIV